MLGWVAERFPALVRAIAARGHEIASHGYAHRLVYDQTPDGVPRRRPAREGSCSRTPAARRCIGYRAPSYSITPRSLWALDVLIEEGYRYDASIFPIHHDRYGIPIVAAASAIASSARGGALVEVPGSTVAWGPMNLPVAGGGYFRLLPYALDALGHRARQRSRRPRPAIFYLHPWEIDPDQPRLRAPAAQPVPALPQSRAHRSAAAPAAAVTSASARSRRS